MSEFYNDEIVPQIRRQGRTRFDFLGGCLNGNIAPTDIDNMFERHRNFLGFEFKQPGEEMPQGQEIALRAWLNPRSVSLVQVEGIPPKEIHRYRRLAWNGVWNPGDWVEADAYVVRDAVRRWWDWADRNK